MCTINRPNRMIHIKYHILSSLENKILEYHLLQILLGISRVNNIWVWTAKIRSTSFFEKKKKKKKKKSELQSWLHQKKCYLITLAKSKSPDQPAYLHTCRSVLTNTGLYILEYNGILNVKLIKLDRRPNWSVITFHLLLDTLLLGMAQLFQYFFEYQK